MARGVIIKDEHVQVPWTSKHFVLHVHPCSELKGGVRKRQPKASSRPRVDAMGFVDEWIDLEKLQKDLEKHDQPETVTRIVNESERPAILQTFNWNGMSTPRRSAPRLMPGHGLGCRCNCCDDLKNDCYIDPQKTVGNE